MTRGTVTKLILLGNFLAVALVVWTAVHIVRNPPEPKVTERGAFRCDASWRLPCDEVR